MEIVARLDAYSSDPKSGLTLTEAEDFYSSLLAWSHSIPNSVRLQESSLPFVLMLQ